MPNPVIDYGQPDKGSFLRRLWRRNTTGEHTFAIVIAGLWLVIGIAVALIGARAALIQLPPWVLPAYIASTLLGAVLLLVGTCIVLYLTRRVRGETAGMMVALWVAVQVGEPVAIGLFGHHNPFLVHSLASLAGIAIAILIYIPMSALGSAFERVMQFNYRTLLMARYLRRRVIAWFSLLAVTLCTSMVLIVISIMGGWLNMFEQSARGMTGDVVIKSTGLSGFAYYDDMIREVEKLPGVEAATARIQTFGLVNIGGLRTMTVQVMGVDFARAGKVNQFPETLYRQHTELTDRLATPDLTPVERQMIEEKLERPKTFDFREETTVRLDRVPEKIKLTDGRLGAAGDALFDKVTFRPTAWGGTLAVRGQVSEAERERLKAMSDEAVWQEAVDELTRRSRWPGMIVGAGVIDIKRDQSGKLTGIEDWKYNLTATLTVLGIRPGEKVDVHNTTETPYFIVDHSRTKMWQYDQTHVYVSFEQLQRDLGMNESKVQRIIPVSTAATASGAQQTLDTAPQPGKYGLFIGGEKFPEKELELKPGEPLGFKAENGKLIAIGGGERVEVGDLGAAAEWRFYRQDVRPARASEIHIKLKPGQDLYAAREQVEDVVEKVFQGHDGRMIIGGRDAKVQTWEQVNELYLGAIKKEKLLVVFLFGIISIVAIFLIFCIFYMIVAEKTKDIGIIKSVGATSLGVANIFLGYGLVIGIVGAGMGLALSYAIVTNINEIHDWLGKVFKMQVWNPEVYAFETIPNTMDPKETTIIVAVAILASVIGALVPAIRAARMHPVDALRWE